MSIRLTQYSHGAGCGCKIAPNILEQILKSNFAFPDQRLLVGNNSKDDAAIYDIGNGQAIISTTDFFMPIVDDPFQFGAIASANAISDVYAMGGTPIMAIAILGWPINTLPPEIAALVIEGSRHICAQAGIALAGGHSIDAPEPIYGLAVNGIINVSNIKKNNTAKVGDALFLTKAIGVGILATAEKKGIVMDEHKNIFTQQMMKLNKMGEICGTLPYVHSMTDVTGFGLLGHLSEMCEGSGSSAVVNFNDVPIITNELYTYLKQNSIPGGTIRNWNAYGHNIHISSNLDVETCKAVLADPQTSGGLLIAVDSNHVNEFKTLLSANNLAQFTNPIGFITEKKEKLIHVR